MALPYRHPEPRPAAPYGAAGAAGSAGPGPRTYPPPGGGFGLDLQGGRGESEREAARHRAAAQHINSRLLQQRAQPPLPQQQPPPLPYTPPLGGSAAPDPGRHAGAAVDAVPGTGSGASPARRPVVRTFSVLLTDRYGNRWYERDVTCSRVSDLTAILERRLGMALSELLWQGAPLGDAHFATAPDELRLECRTGADSPSPRRQLTLFVEAVPRRVQLEAGSVQELIARLHQLGINAEQLLYKVRTAAGDEVFEPLSSLDALSYEHHVRYTLAASPPPPQRPQPPQPSPWDGGVGAASPVPSPSPVQTAPSPFGLGPPLQQPQRLPPERHLSPAAHFRPSQPAPADYINVNRIMVEAGHLLMAALPGADDEEVAAATARVTQQFKQSYPSAEAGREPTPEELTALRGLVDQYLVSVAGAVGAGHSVFKSVTFGIAGAYPAFDPAEQSGRLQLVPPSVTVSGQPVVLLAHARTDTLIDIRCTLGYVNEENRIVVINLDEFYVNGWITIGKTSATSLFLAFQPDVLRAGVEYHVDLTAFLADSPGTKFAAAQCQFTLYETHEEMRRHEVQGPPPVANGRPPPEAHGGGLPPGGGGGGGFHDELRDFVETKVLPLYQLSSNPRVSKQQFDAIVDDACSDYWRLPPHTVLDEEHKRGILARVKQGIVESRGD
eukprot:TRINITY_DN20928_c0_g1_i1.p1 TRINITY_DN20928_c0_g1~~TRINITY_DN20928_c0_g1_i1.p1  ORF type:complete len:701 (+),score=210.41 TRINITY_DN20928_c0_g1_i1:101-2104(+)